MGKFIQLLLVCYFQEGMAETSEKYEQLINTVAQYRQNEDIYRFKIQQINQSRSKIQDEVLSLSRQYEKKLKDFQSKLEKVQMQNEQLSRQNQLYKRDIEGFESRLIEKEKLISVLILQQNSIVTHSEKSKSENNEDNRNQFFNQEEKGFKKTQKSKILPHSLNSNVNDPEQHNKKTQTFSSYDNTEKKKQEIIDQLKIRSIQSDKEEVTETEVAKKVVPPPPPPNTQKFSKTRNPMVKAKKLPAVEKVEYNYMETQPFEQQQVEEKQVQNEEKEEPQNTENPPHQLLSEIKKKDEENDEEDKNDFFDHLKQEKTPKNRTKKTAQIGAQDFFSQLGSSNPGQTNVMTQIQESSIDYADNSMMSSTTNMLQNQNVTTAPPKRMPKKKPKRERITAVDPNAFD